MSNGARLFEIYLQLILTKLSSNKIIGYLNPNFDESRINRPVNWDSIKRILFYILNNDQY